MKILFLLLVLASIFVAATPASAALSPDAAKFCTRVLNSQARYQDFTVRYCAKQLGVTLAQPRTSPAFENVETGRDPARGQPDIVLDPREGGPNSPVCKK